MLFKVASMASHSTSISLSSCWKRVSEEVLWPGLTRVCAASWWLSPCPKRRMDWMEEVWKMNMWGSTEAACWEAQMSAPQKPQLRKRLCYIKLQSLMAVWMEGNICQSSTYWRLMKLDKSKIWSIFCRYSDIPVFVCFLFFLLLLLLSLSRRSWSWALWISPLPWASPRCRLFWNRVWQLPVIGCLFLEGREHHTWSDAEDIKAEVNRLTCSCLSHLGWKYDPGGWHLRRCQCRTIPTQACWFGVLVFLSSYCLLSGSCCQKELFLWSNSRYTMTIISSQPQTSHVNTFGT